MKELTDEEIMRLIVLLVADKVMTEVQPIIEDGLDEIAKSIKENEEVGRR